MKRPAILLLLMGACNPAQMQDPGSQPRGDRPLEFAISKAGQGQDEASMSEFNYLTYDFNLGSWSGVMGSTAICSEDGKFRPSDAGVLYWPEGKTFSFFAVGYNENVPVPASAVEFGSGMMLYGSGSSGLLSLKNPGHDVDWLAAKSLYRSASESVSLQFRHVCARISRLRFDLTDYRDWIHARELDVASIESMGCSLSDADEQVFVFSTDATSLFRKESWDYTSSASRSLDGRRNLGLASGSCCVDLSYYAFPGLHRIQMRLRLRGSGGLPVIDDRQLSGEVLLPMGCDCELTIKVNPDDRPLDVRLSAVLPGWDQGGNGNVLE